MIDSPANMTDAQLATAAANYAQVLPIWAAKGTDSTLTRYCAAQAQAVEAELTKRNK